MPERSLTEVTEFILDGTHGSPVRTDDGVPVLSAQNVKGGELDYHTSRHTSEREYASFRRRLEPRPGDVLLTIVGTIGRAAVVAHARPVVLQRSVAVLRPNGFLDSRYLFHATQSDGFQAQLARASNTSSQTGVYLGRLGNVTLDVPPLEEQRRIAAILDQADALRAARREAIAHLDTLAMATFLSMFGGSSFGSQKLGAALDSAEVFTDGDWVESKDQDPDGQVRLTQLADVGDGSWLDKSARFLTVEKAAELRCPYLAAGDVLVARMPDPLGRACVFPGDLRPAVTVVDVCVIRVDPERATPEWLAACINTPSVRAQIARYATGTTRSRISRGNLKEVLVPNVPMGAQAAFSKRSEVINRARGSSGRQLAQLDSLFKSLQSRAFDGEL